MTELAKIEREENHLPADPMDVSVLADLLFYNANTGKLFWKHRPEKYFRDTSARPRAVSASIWNARDANTEAFTSAGSGGVRIGKVLGKTMAAHRVAFALHYGRWPHDLVDHINGDPADNRISNLREANRAQNGQNAKSRGGRSKYCGVSWDRRCSRWIVQCSDPNGRGRYVGSFKSEIEAAKAYDAAAIARHGEFARTNFEGDLL